jgi:glycosyltransferase involved in cell wall biosynthesis
VENAYARPVLCFATQGPDHLDAERLRYLLAPLSPTEFRFDHDRKLASALSLARTVRSQRPRLIVMEGTGLGGGLVLIALRGLCGIRYVVSSGDAVGPYLRLYSRVGGAIGAVYERVLCRWCSGFIGWTPYLAGRALTFGAPRAMTAPGWSRDAPSADARDRVRAKLGVAERDLVVGIVGTLNWTESVSYAYGLELVRAAASLQRDDMVICIVGDGSGRARLEALASEVHGVRVLFTGRVAPDEVADHLAAFDIASLPQSVDGVGAFRYSTKLTEYLAAGLPIITGEIPAAYDLDAGFVWRLPGEAPWSRRYIDALVALLQQVSPSDVETRHRAARAHGREAFDREAQQRRATAFIEDILTGAGVHTARDGARPSPSS